MACESEKRFRRWLRFAWVLAALLPLALYLHGLPRTVQTGDSGELVPAAYFLRIPHPSGYPLFVWLVHIALHLFPWGSIFHRAAVMTALFSIGTVLLLASTGRNRMISVGVALCWACSRVFWKYSELPDVFSLHCFLCAAFLWLYCRTNDGSGLRVWGLTLLFFISLGNHLTAAFLFPLLLLAWIREKRRRRTALAMLSGCAILAALYGSLLWMHPENEYSWGEITTAGEVLRHFLREDYGRAQVGEPPARSYDVAKKVPLKPGQQFLREVRSGASVLTSAPSSPDFSYHAESFARDTAENLLPILLLCAVLLFLPGDWRKRREGLLLLGTALLYCGFVFGLIKIAPGPDALLVTERFYLLPQLILCFAVVSLAKSSSDVLSERIWSSRTIAVLLVLFAGANVIRYSAELDLSSNTIIEDYAKNFLAMMPKRAIMLSDNDTSYFSLRYCQQIFGIKPNVVILSAPLMFHPWYVKKVQEVLPGLRFDSAEVARARTYSLEDDLIAPNVAHFPFFVPHPFSETHRFRVTYLPVGARIDSGEGEATDSSLESRLQFRSDPSSVRSRWSQYDIYRDFYSRYADIALIRGLESADARDYGAAAKEFETALNRVNYCIPALRALCTISARIGQNAKSCELQLSRVSSTVYDYYGR